MPEPKEVKPRIRHQKGVVWEKGFKKGTGSEKQRVGQVNQISEGNGSGGRYTRRKNIRGRPFRSALYFEKPKIPGESTPKGVSQQGKMFYLGGGRKEEILTSEKKARSWNPGRHCNATKKGAAGQRLCYRRRGNFRRNNGHGLVGWGGRGNNQ